jgi:hypothetical protein
MGSRVFTQRDIARTTQQQMLFVYMLLVGGIAILSETLLLTGLKGGSSAIPLYAEGYGVPAFLFIGAYYLRQTILKRAASVRTRLASPPLPAAVGRTDHPQDPGFCPSCGSGNEPLVKSCSKCNLALQPRDTFLLEATRQESDIRRLQTVFGFVSAFLFVFLAWGLSPLTHAGRDFEGVFTGSTPPSGAPGGFFLLILLGPLAAWVGWQATKIRSQSVPGKLILSDEGVTLFDDSRNRFSYRWGDPGLDISVYDTLNNPSWDRRLIFVVSPKRGSGSIHFTPVSFEVLKSSATKHGLFVNLKVEPFFAAGPVQAYTISPSLLPVNPTMQPR